MIVYRSIAKSLGFALTALGLTAMAAWSTTQPDVTSRIYGWMGIGLFGLATIAFLAQLARRGPVITLDAVALRDHRRSWLDFPWSAIKSVYVGRTRRARFLCIELVDEEAYLSRASDTQRSIAKANRWLGFPAVTISVTGLACTVDEIVDWIRTNQPRKVRT
jgi:hypothetical protein